MTCIMSLRDSFVAGEADLADFVRAFKLDLGSFFRVLRETRSIATGVQVILFMSGRWRREQREKPKALVLDVLCHTSRSRAVLQRFLERAGYAVCETSCCHNLGEWRGIPSDKRTCMVQGSFMRRVVHLIELARPVVQTVLSRVYGSMAGTYITGGGRAVSLFPHLTFVEQRCWVPARYDERTRSMVAAKYSGWRGPARSGDDPPEEVSALGRTVTDATCWSLSFDTARGHLIRDPQQGRSTGRTRFVSPVPSMHFGRWMDDTNLTAL